jgi:hypothetical protein
LVEGAVAGKLSLTRAFQRLATITVDARVVRDVLA